MINQYKKLQKDKFKNKHKNNNNNKQIDISLIRNDMSIHEEKNKEESKLNESKNNNNQKHFQLTEVLESQTKDNLKGFLRKRIVVQKNNLKNNKKSIDKNNKITKKIVVPQKLMVSDLLIKNNNKLKANILPRKTKLRSFDINLKENDLADSKIIKLKKILNKINQRSIKPNINIINKQNIIHHFTTNITNFTKKNYYSNMIINGNVKDNENSNLNLQSKDKILKNLIKKKNEKTINNDYLKNKLSKNKDKILNLKVDLKKKILNNKIINKNINKQNKKIKNSMNKEKNIINDENKNYGNLTLREKIPSNQINNIRLKIFTNSFPMNQNKLNETNSKIKKFNLNNNIRHLNKIKKNKFSKSKNDLTLEHTSRHNKNINTTITSETANKYLNSFIIIDDILQKTKGDFFENKNKNTIRKPKLSIKLKKLDTFSIDNEVFNFTERRDNINLNIKNLENLTKSNLNKKQTIKNNLKKLNLKYLLKINNISKIDNTLPINYQRNLQTQRNKPSKFTIFQNNKNIFNYLNTDIGSKNSNILSNLDKNNIGHIKSKELFSNYIRNNNRIYSNDIRNNINKTSDSIKINNDSKKKKFLQKFKNIENLHNKYFKMINKNDNTYIKNLNCSKYNTIDNKFIDTSRI